MGTTMQELAGRLTALDPEASATLKVVSYFDTLVDHEVGIETLLRGASVLGGCPAGFHPGHGAGAVRMAPDGRPMPPGAPGEWPAAAAGPDAVVWLERDGTPHANDAMILERLALAVAISRSRARPGSGLHRAIERILDASVPEQDRATAAAQLRLDPRRLVRAVARPASDPATRHPNGRHLSGIVSTPMSAHRSSGGWSASTTPLISERMSNGLLRSRLFATSKISPSAPKSWPACGDAEMSRSAGSAVWAGRGKRSPARTYVCS